MITRLLFCKMFISTIKTFNLSKENSVIQHISNYSRSRLFFSKPNTNMPSKNDINTKTNLFSKIFDVHDLDDAIISDHRWLLRMSADDFQKKIRLLKDMNFTHLNHAIPFFRLEGHSIIKLKIFIKRDIIAGHCLNRLYYLNERLQCEPYILSCHLSKRIFVYKIKFKRLETVLDVLEEMEIPGEKIVKDLWILKYNPETIHERLEKVKSKGVSVATWMVRSPEDVVERFVDISISAKKIMGDSLTMEEYLAKRLNTRTEVILDIYKKYPIIYNSRVNKMKEFIDYLLSEGYTPQDILDVPRILCRSIEIIRNRINKLKEGGIPKKNFRVLCKTNKDFDKLYNKLTLPLYKYGKS